MVCLASFIGSGCKTTPPPSLPAISDIQIDSAVSSIPAIDVHTHSFNAHDIPVEHIGLGRRDALGVYGLLVPNRWARQLGALLLGETRTNEEVNPLPEPESIHRASTNQGPESRYSTATLTSSAAHRALHKLLTNRQQELHDQVRHPVHLTLTEKIVIFLVKKYAKDHPAKDFHGSETLSEMVGDFLYDLTSSDEQLTGAQFYKENSSNIVFRVSHMMDMGPTYGMPDGAQLRPFAKQIERMDELQHQNPATLTYFVAYSPYRDNQAPGDSMALVEDALTHHHAYGVKVYPPAGYSAISNVIPPRPCRWWHLDPAKQWTSRYTERGRKIAGGELDQRLLRLLEYCASNKIPVFAHCMDSEMKAWDDYGKMADAQFWREALEAHPSITNLFLCLAHAGGEEWWFGEKTTAPWGSNVYYLCTHYPNVYCEFGDLDGMFLTNNQARFATNLLALSKADSDNAQPCRFFKKIMYGSDWFMPFPQCRKLYFQDFQQVFLWPPLRDQYRRYYYYRRFFFENALDFLNARERVNDGKFVIDSYVRQSLVSLIAVADSETK